MDSAAGGLSAPTGLAWGPDGNLYVASSGTNQILRFDGATGAFQSVFVEDEHLIRPFSISFGPDDDLYVSSSGTNQVLHFDGQSGRYVGVAAEGHGLAQPIGLRFGPEGMLYVANSRESNVLRFTPSGGLDVTYASDSLRFPSDVLLSDTLLYVTSAFNARVVLFHAGSGSFLGTFAELPGGGAPVGLAQDEAGAIFVGDFAGNRLLRFGGGLQADTVLAVEGMAGPENITLGPGR